jgi:hypothetical protein
MASSTQIFQFEHAEFLVSQQKLERAKGIEVVRIKREQRAQELLQFTAVRALWFDGPEAAEEPTPLRKEKRQVRPPNHRPS